MIGKEGKPFTPPSFGHIYKMTTVGEKNVHGSWYNWDITTHAPVEDQVMYSTSKQFAADMEKSKVQQLPPF